jgi:mRNA interferase MazF
MTNKKFYDDPHSGDIVLVPFPFTDLSSDKARPALVIADFIDDMTVLYITKNIKNQTHSVLIEPGAENCLKYKSNIVTSKIATIGKKMVLGQVGVISQIELVKVKSSLKGYLGL